MAGILEEGPIRKMLRERKLMKQNPVLPDELIRQVDKAIIDEEEAWKMYDRMRTDMVTLFPVGSTEYNIFVGIAGDEMRHREELRRIRNALTARR